MPTLDFKGKQFVYSHHLSVPFRELRIEANKSLNEKPGLDDNIIIHGDNLHALKALLPLYAGKVKCIYIDPPYNTGKEGWCFNDNVRGPIIEEWLKKSANPVEKEDMERHDKWCTMMWPRISLLRELLSEDGVIFVSLDDNEIANFTVMMSEIFGDKNWVGTIIWKNVTDNNPTNVAVEHEYVVCFARDKTHLDKQWKSPISEIRDALVEKGAQLIKKFDDDAELKQAYKKWFKENKHQLWPLDRYKFIDRKGIFTGSQSVHNPGREGYHYDIPHPATGLPCQEPMMGYRFPPETIERYIAEDRFLYGKDESKIVELKLYAQKYSDKLPSVIHLDGRTAAYELREIFPDRKKAFDNPKPSQFVKQLLSFVVQDGDIVLDSFAGSGTTAHAVLDLNRQDGGSRRFILVEFMDYAGNTTAERVRRVSKGVETAKNETVKNGLGGTFTYCTLGNPIDIDKLLQGDKLPTYEALARYVFYTATGKALGKAPKARPDFLIGETDIYRVHLIYQPDRGFLRSNASALNADMVERIAVANENENENDKRILVFATAKFMGQKELTAKGIEFCQLPYAIHRVLGN